MWEGFGVGIVRAGVGDTGDVVGSIEAGVGLDVVVECGFGDRIVVVVANVGDGIVIVVASASGVDTDGWDITELNSVTVSDCVKTEVVGAGVVAIVGSSDTG